jgi:dynein heavy chain
MEESKTGPRNSGGPVAKRTFEGLALEATHRHVPDVDFVEPKVFVPYNWTPGLVPRRIEVERKKRQFAVVDLTQAFKDNGVVEEIKATINATTNESVRTMPLPLFDNTDLHSRPTAAWHTFIKNKGRAVGIPARAMYFRKEEKFTHVLWRQCEVIDSVEETNQFVIVYKPDERFAVDASAMSEHPSVTLDALFVCFDAEDPELYCKRLIAAAAQRKRAAEAVALNLYVDCMPVDNLKPLDSEQVNRILENAITMVRLRQNSMLDTSSLLQQYNLNHMRTMNQLIFVNLLRTQQKNLDMVRSASLDPTLFVSPDEVFSARKDVVIGSDTPFLERSRNFKFSSLWNKMEAMMVIYQMQVENLHLDKAAFFFTPEKSQRLEEFVTNQATAGNALTALVKESWVNGITASVRHNLKEVKKGWFNIDEANLEVYKFSKLRRFMFRINFKMEDTVRDLMYRMISEYCGLVKSFCPSAVNIKSNDSIELVGGRFPLFVVDLKFVNATPQTPAKFVYSASKEALSAAIMTPFDNVFKSLKGIVKVERRVMKKLFWAYEPIMSVPHGEEEWAVSQRASLLADVTRCLDYMTEYIGTLLDYKTLIEIDIEQYTAEAVKKFFPGETMNMPELCALARKHARDSESVMNDLPSSVSIGLVQIDCKSVKTMLAAKHKAIANKLFQLLDLKTREYAESVMLEFRAMYDVVTVAPANIEKITELRDFMATLPQRIDQLGERIGKSDSFFALLEAAKWQLPMDAMDLRWEVFHWPAKIGAEIAKQEKNIRVLEYNYKRAMEEEQQEFGTDLLNLQADVGKLKDLTKLSEAAKNAETVRRIRQTIQQCEEKARVFNSREGLFNAAMTEYTELSEVSKTFEPFFDLWDSCEKWLSNKETWTNGPFLDLDSEVVEISVNTLLRNLQKSAKTFERNNLSQCNVIAAQVRDEVDQFRPKVPLIVCLRNRGMRERHWDELATKANVKFPADKTKLTLQGLVDMGLVKAMGDVEKVAEKAGKEYSIETALDKMTKAWESVMLIIEAYRDTGTAILKGVDDYMSLLDEHITMTQAMAFSAFKGPFEQRIDSWNTSLQIISEVVDEWVQLQRNWLYLQPIFDSADINKQLPQEGKRFTTVDKYWRSTMQSAIKGVLAVKFCDDARLLERFKEGNKLLEMVQKGLADYLETKRAGFSRFYFLSNDELLEILSETKDPLRVQPHLRKCFEGIKTVDFQPDMTITGMYSPEQEYVPFVKPVDPKNKNIEAWMVEVKDAMIAGVRDNMYHAILDYAECSRTEWMQKWAGQVVLNGSQVHWTREVEEALKLKGNEGAWDYYAQLVRQLEDMVILIRGKISKAARVTVGALAVVDVHARDVQKKMAEAGVSRVTDFDWISQMRYYWEGDIKQGLGDLAVIMVSSKRWYGNEYLGNSFRLVITPLTDKCYLTLMGALQMILGGAPAGPAGTGKTETTKGTRRAFHSLFCIPFSNWLLLLIHRPCEGPGQAVRGVQLLGRPGLHGDGQVLQGPRQLRCLGVLRRVQPHQHRGAERDRAAGHPVAGHRAARGEAHRLRGHRHPGQPGVRGVHHDEPRLRGPR